MRKRYKVLLSIGSNINAKDNMQKAKEILIRLLGDVKFSSTISTEPIGVDSEPYLNCVAAAYTTHGYPQLHRAFKQIERQMGSTSGQHHKGIVKIDIDILQLADTKFHEEDWDRFYIKQLLPQIQNFEL